ncbi:MAG: NUDIX domain-containing protein [Candidatus Moraniibacteriota bacterium]|nr:MAG: NUDIX domain-containing protein [Candidatus Moranbacteria bacterium]
MKNDQKEILKIGALIISDKKLLVVRKVIPDNRLEFIIPGGKGEKEETPKETLERELQEELGVHVNEIRHFGSFDGTAVFENIPIHMEVYFTNRSGFPQPQSEIKDLVWIDRASKKAGSNWAPY